MSHASTSSPAQPVKVLERAPTVLVFDQPRENASKTENIQHLEALAQQTGSAPNPLFESLLEEGKLGDLDRSLDTAIYNKDSFDVWCLLFATLGLFMLGVSLAGFLFSLAPPWGFSAAGLVSVPLCLVFNKQRKKSLKKVHRAKKAFGALSQV